MEKRTFTEEELNKTYYNIIKNYGEFYYADSYDFYNAESNIAQYLAKMPSDKLEAIDKYSLKLSKEIENNHKNGKWNNAQNLFKEDVFNLPFVDYELEEFVESKYFHMLANIINEIRYMYNNYLDWCSYVSVCYGNIKMYKFRELYQDLQPFYKGENITLHNIENLSKYVSTVDPKNIKEDVLRQTFGNKYHAVAFCLFLNCLIKDAKDNINYKDNGLPFTMTNSEDENCPEDCFCNLQIVPGISSRGYFKYDIDICNQMIDDISANLKKHKIDDVQRIRRVEK